MKLYPKRLTTSQLDRLSEFFANLALVFFAALIIPIFTGIDSINLIGLLWGGSGTVSFLIISLLLAKGK